jgi:hypothetical protein
MQEAAIIGEDGEGMLHFPLDSTGSIISASRGLVDDDDINEGGFGMPADVEDSVANGALFRHSQLVALRRKFKSLRQESETEPLPFNSRVFTVSPPSGVVRIDISDLVLSFLTWCPPPPRLTFLSPSPRPALGALRNGHCCSFYAR